MSSTSQAFVKAFARSGKSSTTVDTTAQQSVSTAAPSKQVATQVTDTHVTGRRQRTDPASRNSGLGVGDEAAEIKSSLEQLAAALEASGIRISPGVAETTEVWIDQADSSVSRLDRSAPSVPPAHIEPQQRYAGEAARVVGPQDRSVNQPASNSVDATPKTPATQPAEQELNQVSQDDPSILRLKAQEARLVAARAAERDGSTEPKRLYEGSVFSAIASIQNALPAYGIAPAWVTHESVVEEASGIETGNIAADVSASTPRSILRHEIEKAEQSTYSQAWSAIDRAADDIAVDDAPHRKDAVSHQEAIESIAEVNTIEGRNAADRIALQANWEVPVFDVPQTVADLFFEGGLFQDLGTRMHDAVSGGLQSMLMTSAMAGEGRSTIAIGVSLAAAATGLNVALLDGDLAEPTLATDLRLDLDHGWIDHCRRGIPLREIAVQAIEDNLCLIPLLPPDPSRRATAEECGEVIDHLKSHFDLIIVDGPVAHTQTARVLSSSIDSVIIVHDVNQSGEAATDLLASKLRRAGFQGIGVIENFN